MSVENAVNKPQSPLSLSTAPAAGDGAVTKSWQQQQHRNDDIAAVRADGGAADAAAADDDDDDNGMAVVWPSEETVLAVAEFCELHALPPGVVCLHLYPFSSDTAMIGEVASKLEHGTWPPQ